MADQATLQGQKRTVTGKEVKQLRRQGLIPANLSGRHTAPIAIQMDRMELNAS
jgi:ribosomal protein L25 (general stress protein Ctc)